MVDLELVKKHLNIDANYTDDDSYLNYLIKVATDAVIWQTDKPIEDSEAEISENEAQIDGELEQLEQTDATEDNTPELGANEDNLTITQKHAVLLLIGELYNNREVSTVNGAKLLPKSFDYLVGINRWYSVG